MPLRSRIELGTGNPPIGCDRRAGARFRTHALRRRAVPSMSRLAGPRRNLAVSRRSAGVATGMRSGMAIAVPSHPKGRRRGNETIHPVSHLSREG